MISNKFDYSITKGIIINLGNKPRNPNQDAQAKALGGLGTSEALNFSEVSRFVHKIDNVVNILKNKNNETTTPYPHDIQLGTLSDTYIDMDRLRFEIDTYVTEKKQEYLQRLLDLKATRDDSFNSEDLDAKYQINLNQIHDLQTQILNIRKQINISATDKRTLKEQLLLENSCKYQEKSIQNKIDSLRTENIIYTNKIILTTAQDLTQSFDLLITEQEEFVAQANDIQEISIENGDPSIHFYLAKFYGNVVGNFAFASKKIITNILRKQFGIYTYNIDPLNYSNIKVSLGIKGIASETDETDDGIHDIHKDSFLLPNSPSIQVTFYNKYTIIGSPVTDTKMHLVCVDSSDIPYLKELQNKLDIKIDKEFFPPIPILEDRELIDDKNINYDSYKEILRNQHVSIDAIHEGFKTILKQKIITESNPGLIFNKTVSRSTKELQTIASIYTSGEGYTAQNDLCIPYKKKWKIEDDTPTPLIFPLKTTSLKDYIQDCYFMNSISLDTKEEASIQYLYEFFKLLKNKATITESKFDTYSLAQDNSFNNPEPYLLENRFTLRNMYLKSVYSFHFITEDLDVPKPEELLVQSKSDYSDDDYNDVFIYQDFGFIKDYFMKYSTNVLTEFNIKKILKKISANKLEIYIQDIKGKYNKITVYGLRNEVTTNYLRPIEPVDQNDFWWIGIDNEKIDKNINYNKNVNTTLHQDYRTTEKRDSGSEGTTEVSTIIKDVKIILSDLNYQKSINSIQIPIWIHNLTDNIYWEKDSIYTLNTIDLIFKDSLKLQVIAACTEEQLNPFLYPDKSYWINNYDRSPTLAKYLDVFINKNKTDEVLVNVLDDSNVLYNDFIDTTGVATDILSYFPINPKESTNLLVQHKVSNHFLGTIQHNPSSELFEETSFYNRTVGKLNDPDSIITLKVF